MFPKLFVIFLVLAAASLSACTTLPTVKHDASNSIKTLAVLPMTNNTNDVDAPMFVRSLLTSSLEGFFYTVKAQEETDLILKDQIHKALTQDDVRV